MLENYGEVLKPEEVCEILLIGRNSLYKLLWSKNLLVIVTVETGR